MKNLFKRLWNEPAVAVAALVGALNACLFLPDWKAAAASIVLSLGGGVIVRKRVTPVP